MHFLIKKGGKKNEMEKKHQSPHLPSKEDTSSVGKGGGQ